MRGREYSAPFFLNPKFAKTRNHSLEKHKNIISHVSLSNPEGEKRKEKKTTYQFVFGISLALILANHLPIFPLCISVNGSQKNPGATASANPMGHISTMRWSKSSIS